MCVEDAAAVAATWKKQTLDPYLHEEKWPIVNTALTCYCTKMH